MIMSERKLYVLLVFSLLCINVTWEKECSFHKKGFFGMFSSPSYPDNYGNNARCDWLITSIKGTKIQLRFTDFQLEESTLCQYDVLEVYDGDSSNSPSLGRYCGSSIKDLIVSSGHQMYIKMTTDGADSWRGFEASWLSVDRRSKTKSLSKRQNTKGCGETILTGAKGAISSPNYGAGKKYLPKSNCRWTIKTDSEHEINLKFETFNLESHSECLYDYITIEGSQIEQKDKYCGKDSPNGINSQRVIKSLSNQITIEFKSDSSTEDKGFRAVWTTTRRTSVTPSECGGELSGETGTITSPDYPRSSKKQRICTWEIKVPEGGRVKLEFIDLNIADHLRCSTGYVQIKDRVKIVFESLGVYCGNVLPAPIRSKGNGIQFGYLSDKNKTTRGFRAKWSTFYKSDEKEDKTEKDTPCDSVLSEDNGVIVHTDGGPCQWTIQLPSTKRAILSVVSINMKDDPTCQFESLQAEDQSSQILFKTCGNLKPLPVISSSNRIIIKHNVRQRHAGSSFKLQWQAVDNDANNNIFDTGSCIKSTLQGIVLQSEKGNGKGLQPDHIPWMVQLQSSIHCAGAILSPDWVMSSAHCFRMPMLMDWLVRAGDPNLFSIDGSEQIVKIAEIYFHPRYNSTNSDNDIVLLRLKSKLTFDSKVRSICLPDESQQLTEGQECSVSGWGTSKYLGKPRETLFQVFPKIVRNARCNSVDMYNGRVTPNMLCAGQGGKDTCQGDGGSPLVCTNKDRFFAVGLASWGNGCAGKHGVYTDLRKQVSWIKSIMERNKA